MFNKSEFVEFEIETASCCQIFQVANYSQIKK